jgi:hypothetical protein
MKHWFVMPRLPRAADARDSLELGADIARLCLATGLLALLAWFC